MFELYFGAFDILLYVLAFIAAVMLSGGVCDAMDAAAPISATTKPSQRTTPTYVSCEPLRQVTRATTVELRADEKAIASTQSSSSAETKLVLRLSDIKLYKLHQRSVVLLSALPFSIPDSIKRYVLRGEPVVRLESLQEIVTVLA